MTKEDIKKKIALIRTLILLYKKYLITMFPIREIIVHYSYSPRDWGFQALENDHRLKGYKKSKLGFHCGYQYVIVESGDFYHCRTDLEMGYHTKRHNWKSIGICVICAEGNEKAVDEELKTLESIINRKRKKYHLSRRRVYGHRNFSQTACPGDTIYRWIKEYRNS